MTERKSRRTSVTDEPVATTDADEPMSDEPMSDESTAPVESTADLAEAAPSEPESPEAAAEAPAALEAAVGDAPAEAEAEAQPDAEAASEAAPAELAAASATEPEAEAAPAAAPRRSKTPVEEPAPAAAPSGPRGLRKRYLEEVAPALSKQFEYANPNMVPRLSKIVVNIGLGEALTNAKAIDAASSDLTMITGQKPIVMKARRSIAQFRVRTGNPIGLKVTLRGQRMWDFLERLTLLALPRIRDFRGTPGRSFDGRGNYTLGLREQIAFPEIDYDKVDRLRGLEVSIVTTAKSDEESKRLLELLGMPFAG
jgi:large subunit ribosomal protein L5